MIGYSQIDVNLEPSNFNNDAINNISKFSSNANDIDKRYSNQNGNFLGSIPAQIDIDDNQLTVTNTYSSSCTNKNLIVLCTTYR